MNSDLNMKLILFTKRTQELLSINTTCMNDSESASIDLQLVFNCILRFWKIRELLFHSIKLSNFLTFAMTWSMITLLFSSYS